MLLVCFLFWFASRLFFCLCLCLTWRAPRINDSAKIWNFKCTHLVDIHWLIDPTTENRSKPNAGTLTIASCIHELWQHMKESKNTKHQRNKNCKNQKITETSQQQHKKWFTWFTHINSISLSLVGWCWRVIFYFIFHFFPLLRVCSFRRFASINSFLRLLSKFKYSNTQLIGCGSFTSLFVVDMCAFFSSFFSRTFLSHFQFQFQFNLIWVTVTWSSVRSLARPFRICWIYNETNICAQFDLFVYFI